MNRPIRWSLWSGVAALLIVAVIGHWYYWYAPRSRTGSPRAAAPTSQVFFGQSELPLRLWVPYPHQNLAALEGAVGDLAGWTEVSSYLIAEDLAILPSFGPFRLPPARDLAVRGSPAGDRLVVAADVYPLVARLARVAGWLAGNPWLAGGSIDLQGSRLQVEWRGSTWLATQGNAALTGEPNVPELPPTHALLGLEEPYGPVPMGLYRLDVTDRGWRLASIDAPPERSTGSWATVKLPPSLALVAAATSSKSEAVTTTRVLAMPAGTDDVGEQLTRSVVAQRGGGERWRLPTERLLSGLGFEVREAAIGEWSAVAFDDGALREVTGQLPQISGLIDAVEDSPLVLGLWLDVAAARRALEGLVRAIESLPLPVADQVRQWTVAAKALSCLESEGSLRLQITGSPPRLEARFQGQDAD